MANTKARTALDQIHALLNGEEWDSDTTSAIATVIQEYGYTIYNPDIHGDEVANAPLPEDTDYTYEHLEAAACMWEHVLAELRRNRERNPWEEYREAYGMAQLRAVVIRHAPKLEAAYLEAVANGYDKDFDWEYVPKYMQSHMVAILT
jgi:hypothetical protein